MYTCEIYLTQLNHFSDAQEREHLIYRVQQSIVNYIIYFTNTLIKNNFHSLHVLNSAHFYISAFNETDQDRNLIQV